MEIRKACIADLPRIMEIYDRAKEFMRQNGNAGQWVNGYPQRNLIENDIRDGRCYVCTNHAGIAGVFVFITTTEPTYREIYDGNWLNNDPYGVVHRLAVSTHGFGTGKFCLEWCFRQCKNIRIDTHRNNAAMQKLLVQNGYVRCGIIRLVDKTERIAFQRIR